SATGASGGPPRRDGRLRACGTTSSASACCQSRIALKRFLNDRPASIRATVAIAEGKCTMWDETKQRRLQHLHEVKEQKPFAEAEQAEYSALTQERCHAEEAAIAEATQREEETN